MVADQKLPFCFLPEARVPRANYRLSSAVDAELTKDDRNVVTNGAFANSERRADRVIIKPLRNQFEDSVLAGGEIAEQWASA